MIDVARVHLWTIPLTVDAGELARLEAILSEDERQRAARFHHERDRVRYAVCRARVRLILGRYLNANPGAIRFDYGPNGKPTLIHPSSDLRFNVAHDRDLGVVAITRGAPIGVDLESVEAPPEAADIARTHFSARERGQLETAPAELRPELFFRCWTRKEAYLKAIGVGLAHPLTAFSVGLEPDHCRLTLPAGGDADQWSVLPFSSGERIGAVAIRRQEALLDRRQWGEPSERL
jgi:4'-phosphopantetheinyl transferase